MRLWYDKGATEWTEALPIGNGHMGAMCYGGEDGRYDLSENTCWSGDGNPSVLHEGARESMSKARALLMQKEYAQAESTLENCVGINKNYGTQLPMGRLFVAVEAAANNTSRSLDLTTGVAEDQLIYDTSKIVRKSFLSNPAKIMCVSLTSDETMPTLKLWLEGWSQPCLTKWNHRENTLTVTGRALEMLHSDGLHGVSYTMQLQYQTDGTITWERRGLLIDGATHLTVMMTATTDMFDTTMTQTCKSRIEKAWETGVEKLLSEHIADHSAGMEKCTLTMPDERAEFPIDVRIKAYAENPNSDAGLIALFFQYGRYLIFNTSRPDSLLPAALQGIWNDDRACRMEWTDDMHLDINTQMNYYPAENTGIGDCTKPLLRWTKDILAPSGEKTAKNLYGLEGWCAHTVSNAYGWSAPGWDVGWGTNATCGGWLAVHIWERYLYTNDTDFLAEYYEVLYKGAQFLKGILMREPNSGALLTVPSYSPENVFLADGESHTVTVGATFDTVVTRSVFDIVQKAAAILKREDEFTTSLTATLKELAPYQIGKHGQLQEWFHDYDEALPDHRHTSHLLSLHPFNQIDPAQDSVLKKAIEASLTRRLGENAKDIVYANWAGALLITYYARLLNGEKAGEFVTPMIAFLSRPNMMITHQGDTTSVTGGIYELDGNTGFTAGVAEMLMQSYGGVIRVLPALPKAWKTGSIKGMRCYGGHIIDIDWTEKSATARLIANCDGELTVRGFDDENTFTAKAQTEYSFKFDRR